MYPHRIRLRDPWTFTITKDLSRSWFARGFHRPTISDGEHVWLVCEGMTCEAVVFLDDRPVGRVNSDGTLWSRDITNLISGRHELKIELAEVPDVDSDDAYPWSEVRLEIRLHSAPDETAD